MGIYDRLAHLLNDTITAQLGTIDSSQDWTTDGSDAISIACRIEGEIVTTTDPNGREVTSTVQVITLSNNSLNTRFYRFNLPSRYSPNVEVEAVAIMPSSDKDGNIHETVMFK